MESWKIKDRILEFDPETHTYLVEGIIVPSVTQMMKPNFADMYSGVDKETLNAAAKRGTEIHKWIEEYCQDGKHSEEREVKDFEFLKRHYDFEVFGNEIPVIGEIGGQIYAGRLDLLLVFGEDEMAVADIKTTSTLNREYLGYQLNLYRIAVQQSYEYDIRRLYGVHLRNGTRKMVEIPIKEEKWLEESLIFPEV